MYSGLCTEGHIFEGDTMRELAQSMYNHRAKQVQVINHNGAAVGEINAAAFNEMIRKEEERTRHQDHLDWLEHINQPQRNRD